MIKVFNFKKYNKNEWFVFLTINVFLPFIILLLLQISDNFYVRFICVLGVQAALLFLNILRIRRGRSIKWLYAIIIVLNILVLVFLSNLSFSTSIPSIFRLINTTGFY